MNTSHSKPTRKAILIGCPGGGDTPFLSGVKQDLDTVLNYLKSERGGAWKESEIQKLYNRSHTTIHTTVKEAIADYVFVYFQAMDIPTAAPSSGCFVYKMPE